MNKESIIRKLKDNKPFWIGIIIGIVILMGIVISMPKPIKPIRFIATDDTYYSGADREPVNGNKTFLIAGRYETEFSSAIYYTFIKFDLTNKPKGWDTCNFSFYVYEYFREYDVNMYVMCLQYDWNEQMPGYDIRWNLPFTTAHFALQFSLGLQKINITDYIENHETITVVIFGYGGNMSMGYFDNHIIIYSKEANVSKEYLPQLIWS